MAQPNRKASLKTPKIVVDDMGLKERLVKIGETKFESIKETITRLVNAEFEKLFPGEYGEKPDRINKQRM